MNTFFLAFVLLVQGDWTAYDAADASINATYKAVLQNTPPSERIAIRNDQRAWIRRKNARCGVDTRNACSTREVMQQTTLLGGKLTRSGFYQTLSDAQLLSLRADMEGICRGTSAHESVCERRNAIVDLLNRRGWCWGPDDADSEASRRWMRAGARCQPQ